MLYHIEKKDPADRNPVLRPVDLSVLSAAGWKEEDLEKILAERIDYLIRSDMLWVIFRERKFQEEADILALDEKGILYIFELKRWQSDQSNLLQVIRYGQIFGRYRYEELQDLLRKYTKDPTADLAKAHASYFELDSALNPSAFNHDQRFVVVTAGVDIDTLEAVRYWSGKNLPITALTYHVYEFGGNFFIEFHSYSPEPNDYAALLSNNVVVNTNITYRKDAYKQMLADKKAAAYYDRKTAVDGIQKGDRVFLYHTGVGVCAMGRAVEKFQVADYGGDIGEEHYVKLDMPCAADPVLEPEKCVAAWEINKAVGGSYRFRQTAFAITTKMADEIERLLKEKQKKC